MLRPGDADFEKLLPFNRRTLVRPQVIAQCRTANGVSLAIQWARAHGVALCGHSGGHSYERFSSCSGLLIDVRSMDAVVIDVAAKTARIGAGSLLGDVAEQLFVEKLALPAGSCKPVGIAGLTLGGGHGLSSRKLGLTADNLLSAKIVDATGMVLNASATENPDLFWALRGGGGGNFGVVTEFTFTVHPVDRVIAFRITWPANFPTASLKAWQNFAQTAPDELSFLYVMTGGQGKITGIRCTGLYLPKTAGETPKLSTLKTLLAPLLSTGSPTLSTKQFTYIEAARYFAGNGDPDRVYFKGKSDYSIGALSNEGVSTFIKTLRNSPAMRALQHAGDVRRSVGLREVEEHIGFAIGCGCARALSMSTRRERFPTASSMAFAMLRRPAARLLRFWSAVAERSADTAFGLRAKAVGVVGRDARFS